MPKEESVEYKRGFSDAMNHRRMYVDFDTEKAMPVDWDEYSDKNEREVIAAVVRSPEYQEFFKLNLVRQAMLKWRQARLHADNPAAVRHFLEIGNAIMELVEFYEHAKDMEEVKVDPGHGYDTIMNEDS